MGFVLITRNPRTNKAIAIVNADDDLISEFPTEAAATEAANNTTACKAWGYQIVEID